MAQAARDDFYFRIALVCLTIAVLGFTPGYLVAMAIGRFHAAPIVHIHGAIMLSWMIWFCVQARLVTTGRTAAHRTWGLLGIAIITAMACVTTAVVGMEVAQAELPGQPAGAAHQVRAFLWTSFGGVLLISGLFTAAMANIGRPEVHKRLIVILSVTMLGAPIARWILLALFGLPPAHPPSLPDGTPIAGDPPPIFALPPSLIADLLLIWPILRDRRQLGRVHPTYVIGGGVLLAWQLAGPFIAGSEAWQAVAHALGHLARP